METDIKPILNEIGVKIVKERGDEYIILCPFHDDKHPSASVNRKKQVFNCFSCGGMGLQRFVARASGKDENFARAIIQLHSASLQENENIDGQFLRAKVRLLLKGKRDEDLAEDDLDELNLSYIKYIAKRGISRSTATKWGIGYHKQSNRVVFPIRDHSGVLKGTLGRIVGAIPDDGSKYNLIHYCHASRYLFGESRLNSLNTRIVVESPWTVIRFQEWGLPAVGVLKSQLTGSQLERLKSASKIIIATDNDAAGKKGVLHALKHLPMAKVVLWPKNVDDMKREEVMKAIKRAKTGMEVKAIWRKTKS